MCTGTTRGNAIRSAVKFAESCGAAGAEWNDVWQRVDAALEREGVTLTFDERLAIFEAFLTAEEAA